VFSYVSFALPEYPQGLGKGRAEYESIRRAVER